MTDHTMQPEWVTKLDVAERQLCGAVRYFFERRDPIIVHALVAAGHQLLTDLGNVSGVVGLLKRKNQSGDHTRSLNYAANFFKHADRDPQSRINIAPLSNLTEGFLMDAVVMLQRLKGNIPVEAKIFWSWFITKHQDLFEDSTKSIPSLADIGLAPDDFDAIVALLKFSDVLPPKAFEE